MDEEDLCNEADACRQTALSYLGKPEAPFLFRVAREFDRLAADLKVDHRNDRDRRRR